MLHYLIYVPDMVIGWYTFNCYQKGKLKHGLLAAGFYFLGLLVGYIDGRFLH